MSATLDGTAVAATATVGFIAGAEVAVTVEAEPETLVADGVATSTVTARLVDANGNGVGGRRVTLRTSGTTAQVSGEGVTASIFGDGSHRMNDAGDGTYTAQVTNTKAEEVTVTVSRAGMSFDAGATDDDLVRTFEVAIADDDADEPDTETFTVTLGTATPDAAAVDVGTARRRRSVPRSACTARLIGTSRCRFSTTVRSGFSTTGRSGIAHRGARVY